MKTGKRIKSALVEIAAVAITFACLSGSADLKDSGVMSAPEPGSKSVAIEKSYDFVSGYYLIPAPDQVSHDFIPTWRNLDW